MQRERERERDTHTDTQKFLSKKLAIFTERDKISLLGKTQTNQREKEKNIINKRLIIQKERRTQNNVRPPITPS